MLYLKQNYFCKEYISEELNISYLGKLSERERLSAGSRSRDHDFLQLLGNNANPSSFIYSSIALRTFLKLATNNQLITMHLGSPGARLAEDSFAFGLQDEARTSLAACSRSGFVYRGDLSVLKHLKALIVQWITLDRPSADDFTVQVNFKPSATENTNLDISQRITDNDYSWIEYRNDNYLSWKLI